jgi:hypothetical protein
MRKTCAPWVGLNPPFKKGFNSARVYQQDITQMHLPCPLTFGGDGGGACER